MQDDFRWMPASLFEMATTCRKEGMAEAYNLLTESAILLHVFLAQKQGSPRSRIRLWDVEDEESAHQQDAIAAPENGAAARTADICVLRPRIVEQRDSQISQVSS